MQIRKQPSGNIWKNKNWFFQNEQKFYFCLNHYNSNLQHTETNIMQFCLKSQNKSQQNWKTRLEKSPSYIIDAVQLLANRCLALFQLKPTHRKHNTNKPNIMHTTTITQTRNIKLSTALACSYRFPRSTHMDHRTDSLVLVKPPKKAEKWGREWSKFQLFFSLYRWAPTSGKLTG